MIDDRYAAGFFDADGCVRIARWKKPNSSHVRFQMLVTAANCCLPVVQAFEATYGGSVHKTKIRPARDTHRLQYAWHGASQIAYQFLVRIRPHLIVKADEADLAMELQAHINSTHYVRTGRPKKGSPGTRREGSDEIIAYREDLYRRISDLKKRSYPPLLSDGPSESVNGH